MRKKWGVVAIVALAGVLGTWAAALRLGPQTAFELRVPSGVTGWITVKYGVAGAPPLPVIRGAWIFPIPLDGFLETSTARPAGRHTSRYFRTERGGAVLIAWDPPASSLREASLSKCLYIFVAPRALAHDQDIPPRPDHGCDERETSSQAGQR